MNKPHGYIRCIYMSIHHISVWPKHLLSFDRYTFRTPYLGALDEGCQCRMSMLRNIYVALSNLRNVYVTLSNLRKSHRAARLSSVSHHSIIVF